MQRCGCCGRFLLIGEVFRLYRRRLRGAVVVCGTCRARVEEKGWLALARPAFRQLSKGPRRYSPRTVRLSREAARPPGA